MTDITNTPDTGGNLHTPSLDMNPEKLRVANNFFQPNSLTRLSNDFKSRTVAQIVQHFQDDNRKNEAQLYSIIKDTTFEYIKGWYRKFLNNMLESRKMLDENDPVLVDYFMKSGERYIEDLERDLSRLIELLELYFVWEEPIDYSTENLELRSNILTISKQIISDYFPDVSADISGLIW